MDNKYLEQYILKVLDNLDTVKTTNKIKAEVLALEFLNLLVVDKNFVYKKGDNNASN